MPGLVQNAMPQKQAVNPQIIERIVIAATKAIHTPEISAQLVKMMKMAGDPATGLAQATMLLMKALYEKSKGMPLQALAPAGKQVMQLVAELGEAAGILKPSPQLFQQAAQVIAKMLQQKAAQPAAAQPAQPAAQPAAPSAQPVAPMGA